VETTTPCPGSNGLAIDIMLPVPLKTAIQFALFLSQPPLEVGAPPVHSVLTTSLSIAEEYLQMLNFNACICNLWRYLLLLRGRPCYGTLPTLDS